MITISVQHVSKAFGKRRIVHDLSFEVKEGEVFGFLGPNGAGKTTTIRMMTGLVKPTSGRIRICGYDVQRDFRQAMRHMGSIVENPALYTYMSGRENLQLFARMLGVGAERIDEVVRQVGLKGRADDKVKTYSLGMRQRLGIAQALLGHPKVLILDEPTNGLDPTGMRELRAFIRRLADRQGVTVFVSSHILSEIEAMCDRVAIVSAGRLVHVASVQKRNTDEHCPTVWYLQPVEKAISVMQSHSDVNTVKLESDGTVKAGIPADKIAEVNRALLKAGVAVSGIEREKSSLEDWFMTLTGDDQVD